MEIERSWAAFRDRSFPNDCAGEEMDGICITSVDSFAAGCIDTFLANDGNLDYRRRMVLKQCAADLQTVLPQLTGEARQYFEHLNDLVSHVLNKSRR